jgi:hypothetical protein
MWRVVAISGIGLLAISLAAVGVDFATMGRFDFIADHYQFFLIAIATGVLLLFVGLIGWAKHLGKQGLYGHHCLHRTYSNVRARISDRRHQRPRSLLPLLASDDSSISSGAGAAADGSRRVQELSSSTTDTAYFGLAWFCLSQSASSVQSHETLARHLKLLRTSE